MKLIIILSLIINWIMIVDTGDEVYCVWYTDDDGILISNTNSIV